MRWSATFVPTLKEVPADAEIVSHQLLLRAGLMRKLSGGLHSFLPLGLRSLRKIEMIVREEMDRAGALEVLMPALQPLEIWNQSGRLDSFADVLYKVRDRARKEWALGPTHEEVITLIAANELNSYRQLPKTFYQIQTKFRDEIRPRFGLLRAKEFIMKDAYSFDADDAGAQASYWKMYQAYSRIFTRCGIQSVAVDADTGAIGGKFSHEFMIPAETGENEIVYCETGKYAANIEKAVSQGSLTLTPKVPTGPAPEKFPTPGVVTIDALSQAPHSVPAHQQIKSLVYFLNGNPVIALLRGDDQLNEAKFAAELGASQFRPATAAEICPLLGANPGSLGAVRQSMKNITLPIYADLQLKGAAGMVTGANEDGFHFRNVEVERDIAVGKWFDFRTVRPGELCGATGLPLKIRRGIEVGHVFKLGTKYSERFDAYYLAEDGARRLCVMGCYGLGIPRTLQAIIEQCHDKDGIIWPISVAPFEVCLTPLNVEPQASTMQWAERLYRELTDAGIEVLLDDRDERPGVKFKDSELVGFPLRVNIGERSLAKGEIELKPRTAPLRAVKAEAALDEIVHFVRLAREALAARVETLVQESQ